MQLEIHLTLETMIVNKNKNKLKSNKILNK